MAYFTQLYITDSGKALLAKAIQGTGKIEFTKMCTSSHEYTDEELLALTELEEIKQECHQLTATYPDAHTVKIEAAISNKDLTGGYFLRSIGLYAIYDSDTNAKEILYAVARELTWLHYIPAFKEKTVSGLNFQLVTSIGNAEVTVSMEDGAVISHDKYNELITNVATANATANTAKTTADTANATADTAKTTADNTAIKVNNLLYNNAGAHNSIYRGKNLGTSVTSAQYAAIKAGTFDDMYIGDYWAINGATWRIAAFDYYYNTGNGTTADGTAVPRCTAHHVTIVPDVRLYAARMNETATTAGGYVGSVMYTASLSEAKTTINNAFGAAHILSHGRLLCNAVTDGAPTGKGWYFSTVELMTEQNVTGARTVGAAGAGSISVDSKQFPLFVHNPYFISCDGYWLRDVATATYFVYCNSSGFAEGGIATYTGGVRPAFSIIG